MACAATNLSFLYFLEAEHVNAEKYADIAVKADRYNARALVNKGNCHSEPRSSRLLEPFSLTFPLISHHFSRFGPIGVTEACL